MPVTYRVDAELRFVEARYLGDVTIQEVIEVAARLAKDPTIEPDFKLLSFFTGARTDVTLQEIRKFEKYRKQLRPFPMTAIVAPSDLEYGIARMFMSATAGVGAVEMNIFRNEKDARQWLALPETPES